VKIQAGDIVKHDDSPCEVFVVYSINRRDYLFIMNKKTLRGSFLLAEAVEFVRRPAPGASSSTNVKMK
jgi:hypothetical protein